MVREGLNTPPSTSARMNDTVTSRGMSQQVGDRRPANLAAGLFERIHALELLPRWHWANQSRESQYGDNLSGTVSGFP
ncbi:MAG: hypothetical protein JWP89_2940 [Schlesneria sp.]|nr:hypothetical protein [Schlesneria sp.]